MSWSGASSLILLAWFIVLAIVEVRSETGRVQSSGSDARLLTNFGFGAISLAASSLVPVAKLGSSLAAQRLHTGLIVDPHRSWPLTFLLTLMGSTFVSYWIHRAMHTVPLFWRVHRVHHADTTMDVSTSLRHHPFEMLFVTPAEALIIILVGAPVSVVAAAEGFVVATAIFGHADIRLRPTIHRLLSFVLVTPRLHRLHHHPERRLHDSNYGDTFMIWDRLFGTFIDISEQFPVGLDRQTGRPDHLVDQILSPARAA